MCGGRTPILEEQNVDGSGKYEKGETIIMPVDEMESTDEFIFNY